MWQIRRGRIARLVAVAVASLALATLAVAILERVANVPSADTVYLVAVVASALLAGSAGAVVASVGSVLLYDFFFIEPTFTLTMSDPGEWLNLAVLLFVGIVVGQLAALERARTETAREREREARALYGVSTALAVRASTKDALPAITRVLQGESGMERVWVAFGTDAAAERVVADTGTGPRPMGSAMQHVLRRGDGEEPARWVHVHQPGARRPAGGSERYRVRIEAQGRPLGSIWGLRDATMSTPGSSETRLLMTAADQVGQALAHDRLAAESQAAEIARQSDALKSALLQSVSHDLRTPLATIRAAAGTLRPGSGLSEEDQLESAEAIDREVEYLDRLVSNLLDLSRIEAGALRAERDVFELDDLLARTIERLRPRLEPRPLEVALEAAPVNVDPTFVDAAVTNLLENAIKYTAPGAGVRVAASELPKEAFVRLTVEDAGTGVPDEALGRLFDKFYRVPGRERGSRSGMGIGLAVVRGLVEATGGRVRARRSALGGLAVDLDLPRAAIAPAPPVEAGARGAA